MLQAKQLLCDILRSRRTRPAMHRQRRMRLEFVELVEIVGSCPYFASKYLA